MPDDLAATILAYHNGAARYAEHSRDREHLARLRDPFVALLPQQSLVLEVGAGPGHDAALLADLGATVVALDPAQGLLQQALVYDAISGRLVGGEARNLPFADDSFDGVWSCAALLHVSHEEAPQAISELHRVLKPSGFVFLSMSEGDPSDRVPDSSLGLDTRSYYYHRGDDWGELLQSRGFQLILHHVNRESGNFNLGSTGWIETYARKR
jgi:ubiquinone/menaquinone biosynthesis C-methylase UbiE